MFRYADPANAQRDLTAAGFTDVRCLDITFHARLPHGGDDLVRFLRSGSVRSQAIYLSQSPETRRLIEDDVRARLRRIVDGRDDQRIRLEATVISAAKNGPPASEST